MGAWSGELAEPGHDVRCLVRSRDHARVLEAGHALFDVEPTSSVEALRRAADEEDRGAGRPGAFPGAT